MSITREDLAIEVDEEIMRREGRARLNVEDRTVGPAGEIGHKPNAFTAEVVFANIQRPISAPLSRPDFGISFRAHDLPTEFVKYAPPKPVTGRDYSVCRVRSMRMPVITARPGSKLTLSTVIRHIEDSRMNFDRLLVGMRVDLAVTPMEPSSIPSGAGKPWLHLEAIRLDLDDLMERADDLVGQLFGSL